MMKPSITLFATTFVLFGAVCGGALQGSETQIAAIRSQFQSIETTKGLKKQRLEYEADAPNGYLVERYTDAQGALKKATLKTGGDHGSIRFSFYFHENLPVFAYTEMDRIDFPATGTVDSQRDTWVREEERFYFSQKKCLRYLKKKASSKKRELVAKQLAVAPNVAQDDEDRMAFILEMGERLLIIKTKDQLEKYALE